MKIYEVKVFLFFSSHEFAFYYGVSMGIRNGQFN